MRIISYKLFLESSQDSIESICKKYNIKNYTINDDGSIDVDGSVFLYSKRLTKLPLKFRTVTGYFNCCNNQLTTLEGSPKEVGSYFDCSYNQLTTLEGCPNSVGGNFDCSYNQLTSLIDGPEVVLGSYYAHCNQINSFEGFPDDFEGDCYFRSNPVQKILKEFKDIPDWKIIKYIIEFEAIWNGEIVPERLEMVKDKLGLI